MAGRKKNGETFDAVVRLLKSGRMTVDELCSACGVSSARIHSILKSISDDGFDIVRSVGSPTKFWIVNDLDLAGVIIGLLSETQLRVLSDCARNMGAIVSGSDCDELSGMVEMGWIELSEEFFGGKNSCFFRVAKFR